MVRLPTQFLPNPDLADELLASPQVAEMLAGLGPPLVAEAYARARKLTEHLADSITFEVGELDGVQTGRLLASDFKAAWHEFGTRKMRPQPYLRPTVESQVGPVSGGGRR